MQLSDARSGPCSSCHLYLCHHVIKGAEQYVHYVMQDATLRINKGTWISALLGKGCSAPHPLHKNVSRAELHWDLVFGHSFVLRLMACHISILGQNTTAALDCSQFLHVTILVHTAACNTSLYLYILQGKMVAQGHSSQNTSSQTHGLPAAESSRANSWVPRETHVGRQEATLLLDTYTQLSEFSLLSA